MEKKNVILLTVIAVATLLITVVGATFAYFAATISGTENAEAIKITSVDGLTITYDDGDAVTVSNVIPGWGIDYGTESNTKTITVSNASKYDLEYVINWNAVTNTFDPTDQENLTYSADMEAGWVTPNEHNDGSDPTSTTVSNIGDTKAPTAVGEFDKRTVKAGEKVTYTLKLKYANKDTAQNSQGKQFTGKLIIDEENVKIVNAAA